MRVIRYDSIASLRAAAGPWDDLYQRCREVLPTGRAELIADWLEQFAARGKFIALAIEDGGQLIAALPLLERRIAGLIRVGSLPRNDWCWAGHLLIDLSADVSGALRLLVDELRRLSWPLLWFDTVPLEQPAWRRFLSALDDAGLQYLADERFEIGVVDIQRQGRDWHAYQDSWSGNHRRHMRKALRRAEEEGGVQLDVRRPSCAVEVEPLLREGFEVEHRSWKGREGTSVLASPSAWQFYLRQATGLAEGGNLELTFLRFREQAIAFEYAWTAHGVYYTPKVGFDDEFSRFSPGQLLRYFVLQNAFLNHERQVVDFLGPLSDATSKWITGGYPISRLVIATGKVGRSLLWSGRKLVRPLQAVS